MSVYIKGMEMPKHGSYLFTVRYDADGNLCFYPLIYMTGYDDRDLKPETPLIPILPVPDHGRLIDADALREEVKKHATPSDAWVFSLIRTASTIIPASGGNKNE